MMPEHYAIDLHAMSDAYNGMLATLKQLRELGIHGEETSGATIEELALDEDITGHEAISDRIDEALERSHYAIRGLLADGEDILERLKETLVRYQRAEKDTATGFDKLWDAFTGAPLQRPSKATGRLSKGTGRLWKGAGS